MSPAWLAAGLALASLAVAIALGVLVAAVAEGAARTRRFVGLGPRTRATLLAQARLAPALLALPFAAVVQLAFWRFEPAHAAEPAGPALAGAALAGAALLFVAAARVVRAVRATRVVRRAWLRSAQRLHVPAWTGRAFAIDSPFPVVAVAGVWRPELYVAVQVAGACTPAEMAQVAAHERAHVAARDNLVRAAFAATPMPARLAARLEDAWDAASEEAADVAARGGGSGVTLASALVKVAGLALATAPSPVLASAFIGAESLDGRVQRLLAPAPACGAPAWWLGALAVGSVVAGTLPTLHGLYQAAEFVVGFGR
jgi:Zn-dependent protease with chaperone function